MDRLDLQEKFHGDWEGFLGIIPIEIYTCIFRQSMVNCPWRWRKRPSGESGPPEGGGAMEYIILLIILLVLLDRLLRE